MVKKIVMLREMEMVREMEIGGDGDYRGKIERE
jgi:hypothetical protein